MKCTCFFRRGRIGMGLTFFVCCIFLFGFGATASAISDSFTGTNGTAITTHNANWHVASGSTAVSNITINNNHLHYSASYQAAALYYASSSADASQVTVVSTSTGLTSTPPAKIGACARMSASTRGYCAYLTLSSGGNWRYVAISKNTTPMGYDANAGVPLSSPHTVKVTVSGTTTVTIKAYLDGVLKLTKTDSVSPLGAGSPGVFYSSSSGGAGDAFSAWSDLVINGVCGSNNGQSLGSLASGDANNCLTGTVTNFTGTGPWSWYCAGSGGGNNSGTCTASITKKHTLTYAAGLHGSIKGSSSQTVNDGNSGSAVTAVPDSGYHFTRWSDSSTANPRTDSNVSGNISVTANFAPNTTVYVDPTCGSSGDGTTTTCGTHGPFKTWAEVTWAAGNTYSQKGGTTAHEMVMVKASGTAGSPITINSYGTGKAKIDGGVAVAANSWTGPDANGVYSQPKFNSVILEDGVYLMNTYCYALGCGTPSNWTKGHSYSVNNTAINGGNWYKCTTAHSSDATTEPGVGTNWTNDWKLISSASLVPSIAPAAGQFSEHWAQATEYYHPSSGTPANHVVEKINKAGFDLQGNSYINISGFSFSKVYYGIRSIPTVAGVAASHVNVSHNEFRNIPFGVWLAYNNATATNNTITHNTFDSVMSSIEIYRAIGAGQNVNMEVAYNTITNGGMANPPAFVYDWDYIDMDGWDKEGIGTQDPVNCSYHHNSISGHVRGFEMYAHPSFGQMTGNSYYANYIVTSRAPISIHPASTAGAVHGNRIYNNVAVNVKAPSLGGTTDPMPGWLGTPGTASAADEGLGISIYGLETPDLGNGDSGIYNNTILGYGNCISPKYDQNLAIKNNICYGNSLFIVLSLITDTSKFSIDYNLYYTLNSWSGWYKNGTQMVFSAWKGLGFDSMSINANPKFTNGTGLIPSTVPFTVPYPNPLNLLPSDFMLQSFSPAVKAGTDVGLTSNYSGNPIVGNPDIGAY